MTFESIEEQQDISNKIKEIYENQTDLMSVAKKNVLDLKTIPIDS